MATKAIQAAINEGLHNPTCDYAGNSVARHGVRDIDPAIDAELCREWYGE